MWVIAKENEALGEYDPFAVAPYVASKLDQKILAVRRKVPSLIEEDLGLIRFFESGFTPIKIGSLSIARCYWGRTNRLENIREGERIQALQVLERIRELGAGEKPITIPLWPWYRRDGMTLGLPHPDYDYPDSSEINKANQILQQLPPVTEKLLANDMDNNVLIIVGKIIGVFPRFDRDRYLYQRPKTEGKVGEPGEINCIVHNVHRVVFPDLPLNTHWHEMLLKGDGSYTYGVAGLTMHRDFNHYVNSGTTTSLVNWCRTHIFPDHLR